MKLTILSIATTATLSLLAFRSPTIYQTQHQQNQLILHLDSLRKINPEQLASLKDPICGMDLREHFADTTLYNGKLYGFCAPGCKNAFIKKMERKNKH